VDLTLTTREAIKAAFDIAVTARADAAVDRANAAASEAVQGELHRKFRPELQTISLPWPNPDQHSSTWRLWLDAHELISITSLTVAGTALTEGTHYWLEPNNYGPPYNRIEIVLASTADGFASGDTFQRSIVIVGLTGFSDTERTLGTLAEAPTASQTSLEVDGATAAAVGVGDILRVDTERLWVSERAWLDTTENTAGTLSAAMNDQAVAVSDGTVYATGERLLVDSETMEITAISGNTLTVRRAVDGSTLAAHSSGADIYASRKFTVERGVLGTTAATHISSATVYRHVVPRLVEQVTISEALAELGIQRAGGAVQSGAGTSTQDSSGGGIESTWRRCRTTYGRAKVRFRTVGR
jgi:hypothetical protein